MTVTLTSTDPQEVVDRVLRESVGDESAEAVSGVPEGAETVSESQTEDTEQEEPGKPSKRSQKVKKLAEKLTAAERERDEWRQKFEQSQGRVEQPQTEANDDPYAYPVAKPKASDFPNDPQAFVEALTDWKSEEREYRMARKYEAEEAETTQREIFDSYNTRVAEARAEHEDFEQVVGKSDLKIWPAVQQALLVHEEGPEIVYYLAKNPEVAEKLAEMNPARAVVELGHIAATMKAAPAPKPKPRPALIHPVNGGTTRVEADRQKMSYADWKKARRAGAIS